MIKNIAELDIIVIINVNTEEIPKEIHMVFYNGSNYDYFLS